MTKALLNTKYIEFINKKIFIIIVLNEIIKTFIVYITNFNLGLILTYLIKNI